MSAILAPQPASETRREINRQLANGSLLSYIEVPDANYMLRYDVRLDGSHLGKLVLWSIAPLTQEMIWLSSPDDLFWSPPVNNQQEAIRYLLPMAPVC